MPRQTYSAEVKGACEAALRLGASSAEVAKQYNVAPATVRAWKSRLRTADGTPLAAAQAAEVRALVLQYVCAGLTALREQAARTFVDGDWLRGQNAADAAKLHGTLADQVIRILGALEPPAAEDAADDAGAKGV